MRRSLLPAVMLFGCMAALHANADEPGPVLPNPTVNIQQPPLARPMPAPRPRVSRPDPPVKVASVKKSSRPDRRKSKRRPEKTKSRQVAEAKAKPPVRRSSAVKERNAAPKEAAPPPAETATQHKAPAPDHPLRKPAAAAANEKDQTAPPTPSRRDPVIELRKPDLDHQDKPDVAPAQQTADQAQPPGQAPEPKPAIAAERPAVVQETTAGQQTAAISRPTATDSQEERTRWWARQGSPAVARFRDCGAAYAARNVGKDTTATWADLLIRAAEGDCRVAFNDMASVLTARLGNDAQSVIQSLIETTFLPAARKAAASTQRVAGGKSDPVPAAPAQPQ